MKMIEHWNKFPKEVVDPWRHSNLTGHGAGQPSVVYPGLSRDGVGQDEIFRGPFQPQ